MEEDLVARLCAVAGIAARAGDRVSWFERPRPQPGQGWDSVLDAITLTNVTAQRGWTHEGPTGFDQASIQFDCWSLDPDNVVALRRALRDEMERVPFVNVGGTRFHPGFLQMEELLPETVEGVRIFRALDEYRFNHQPVPG